jgi:hypothetical protein
MNSMARRLDAGGSSAASLDDRVPAKPGFLLATTATIAAVIPARRASLVEPMEALRSE